MKSYKHFGLLVILCIASCKARYHVNHQEETLYKISSVSSTDTLSLIEQYLKPYRDSLNTSMSDVVAISNQDYAKEKGGGSLGYLIAEALQYEALTLKKQGITVNGAIMNPGGIRLNQLTKGPITLGKIFELLPFDNELVYVEMKGNILFKWLQKLDTTAAWPTSAEFPFLKNHRPIGYAWTDTFTVENPITHEVQVKIKNNRYSTDSTYWIATNDYVANGGDQCDFMIPCKKVFTGVLIRQALIDYVRVKYPAPNDGKYPSLNTK